MRGDMFLKPTLISIGCLLLAFVWIGCAADNRLRPVGGDDKDGAAGGDADSDADGDLDADADSDLDADGDADADGGKTEILPDCSACPAVGPDLENLRCAIDLCDNNVFKSQTYTSPTITKDNMLNISRGAVKWFGSTSNDLKPLYPAVDGSYALMSSGYAVPQDPVDAYDHNHGLSGTLLQPDGPSVKDPFSKTDKYPAYDIVEWKLHLKAPANAHGFRIHYIFFSEEYDEYIGLDFNDKFYIFLEAASTNGGQKTVINFTECRDSSKYSDFECTDGMSSCKVGQEYCYIAVNTALSECCWYNGCPDGTAKTDITGTGFSCGTKDTDYIGDYSMGFTFGSSTGWLRTEWPIDPGEEFDITFHVHDTADSILDSEVVLDKFVFVTEADAGTVPIE